jgi:hypothetical protein
MWKIKKLGNYSAVSGYYTGIKTGAHAASPDINQRLSLKDMPIMSLKKTLKSWRKPVKKYSGIFYKVRDIFQ